MFLTPVRPEEPDAENSQTVEEKDSASAGRAGVPSLQLLLELAVKDLIALVFSLLLGVEPQCLLESLMNQETFVQHFKIKPCHVQFTGLEKRWGTERWKRGEGREGGRETERGHNNLIIT